MHVKQINAVAEFLLEKMQTWWLPLALLGGLPSLELVEVSFPEILSCSANVRIVP